MISKSHDHLLFWGQFFLSYTYPPTWKTLSSAVTLWHSGHFSEGTAGITQAGKLCSRGCNSVVKDINQLSMQDMSQSLFRSSTHFFGHLHWMTLATCNWPVGVCHVASDSHSLLGFYGRNICWSQLQNICWQKCQRDPNPLYSWAALQRCVRL